MEPKAVEQAEPGQKYCTGCKQWLERIEFPSNLNALDSKKVWCHTCLARLESNPSKARRERYQKARRKAYQAWFNRQKGSMTFDRRWITKPDTPLIRVRWSSRLKRVVIFDGSEAVEEMRRLVVRIFGCDPADLDFKGRGGGTGANWQPRVCVEGDVDAETWYKGIEALKDEGWTVFREGLEDVVAPGF